LMLIRYAIRLTGLIGRDGAILPHRAGAHELPGID
jgi:hypothetical protein